MQLEPSKSIIILRRWISGHVSDEERAKIYVVMTAWLLTKEYVPHSKIISHIKR